MKLKPKFQKALPIIILCLLVGIFIYNQIQSNQQNNPNQPTESSNVVEVVDPSIDESSKPGSTTESSTTDPTVEISIDDFDYSTIPAYDGTPFIYLNDNVPYFTKDELETYTQEPFEYYNDLDELGRCTYAIAYIDQSLQPTDKRENIGSVSPTGWQSQKNEKPAVYNRCHLIGFQLTGENANKKNLVTGTRALNVDAMLPFENLIDDYLESNNTPILYRVTPYFVGDELVCRGIIMEAWTSDGSVEFCVWCYNNQRNIEIDYATGEYVHTN